MKDRTEDRRQFRLLAVIDEYPRECWTIEVARSFTARDFILTLQYLFAVRGAPQYIRRDDDLCGVGTLDQMAAAGLDRIAPFPSRERNLSIACLMVRPDSASGNPIGVPVSW